MRGMLIPRQLNKSFSISENLFCDSKSKKFVLARQVKASSEGCPSLDLVSTDERMTLIVRKERKESINLCEE